MNFTTPIEHVVVLMMENHSFDNMLGWLPGVGELTGDESNSGADGHVYRVGDYHGGDKNPSFQTYPGPAHDFRDVNHQVFGTDDPSHPNPPPVTMSGFVTDYDRQKGSKPGGVMGCYSSEQVPVISLLAQTFTTCRRWFCSVPGPTGPNRLYANCAATAGYAGPDWKTGSLPTELASLTSIFGVLTAAGLSWGVFCEDPTFAPELVLNDVPKPLEGDPGFQQFLSQIQAGTLPNYSFLTPSLMPNSQHPNSDVRFGECVMADVYNMIATSSYWDKTLFILTYDEHGGFFDSVKTPTGVPNPDGLNWDSNCPPSYDYSCPPFHFDRLGVRVPAILISPYVAAVVDDTQYEHSSIPATVLKLFGLTWPVCNKRIETVNTFETAIGKIMRTDVPPSISCPLIIPPPDGSAG